VNDGAEGKDEKPGFLPFSEDIDTEDEEKQVEAQSVPEYSAAVEGVVEQNLSYGLVKQGGEKRAYQQESIVEVSLQPDKHTSLLSLLC